MPKKLKGTLISVLLLALGGASFLIWAGDQGGDIPPAAEYAPNFWFDKGEKYFPADPLQFYYDENMQELPGSAAVENYNKLSLEEKLDNFTVFYKIDDAGDAIVYQYWLFYVFNYGMNEHYGDWESIFIFTDKDTKELTRVIGSFHQGGAINTEISGDNLKNVKHVWGYVAEGSHSNCPDYEDDGICNSQKWNDFEKLHSGINFISDGPKITPYYNLVALEDIRDKIDHTMITKSEDLGMFGFNAKLSLPIVGEIFTCDPCYTIPLGGDPAQDAWTKAEYADSYAAQPWTIARLTDWIGQNIEAAYNFASGAIKDIAGMFGDALAQVSNFISFTPAGIGPAISNITGGVSAIQQDASGGGPIPVAASPLAFEGGISSAGLQNQLDDITEQIDILSQQIAALAGLPAVLGVSDEDADEQKEVAEEIAPRIIATRTVITNSAPKAAPVYPKLLISEVYDSGTEEFVEIFNPNVFAVDMTGWYMQKKTKSGDGYDSYAPKTLFDGKTIGAGSYFLVARSGTGWPGGVDVYTDYSLGSDNALVLKDPNQDIVDKVGWGAAQDFETAAAPSPSKNNSIGRIWSDASAAYTDTNNNSSDLEIQELTPNAKNTRHESSQESQQTATSAQTYSKILISEVKAEGATSKDELIELYNGNASSVDLTGWALKKKTSGGTESNLVSASQFSGIIPANGYFLVAPQLNDDGTPNYTGSAQPDLFYSGATYSFAKDNTILLYSPAASLVDKVGFGAAQDFEGVAAGNPTVDNSIGRKQNDLAYLDTDNNFSDFELQTPTPKALNITPASSSASAPEPDPASVGSDPASVGSDPTVPPDGGAEPEPAPLPQTVVINEIAWMGTKASASDEWIELYNNTSQSLNLVGWNLAAEDGTPTIRLAGEIPASGFYLLERTNDSTISDIAANQIYAGATGNAGEKFILSDAQGNIIDIVDASAVWFTGDNETKRTMERIGAAKVGSDPTNWANNNLFSRNGLDAGGNTINGTPGRQNSVSREETIISGAILSQLFAEFPEVTLTYLGGPYVARDSLNIPEGKIFIVEPGVTLKFNSEKSHSQDPVAALIVNGSVRIEGTEDSRVLFRPTAENGFWGCFNILETSMGSQINYLTIEGSRCGSLSEQTHSYLEDSYWAMHVHGAQFTADNLIVAGYGGRAYSHGIHLKDAPSETIIENSLFSGFIYSDNIDAPSAVYVDGGNPTIRNSFFQDNAYGILIVNGSPGVEGNTFENNITPVQMSGNSAPDFSGNVADDNNINGILVQNWSAAGDVLWSADLPYVIVSGYVGRDVALTIEPGVVVKFKNSNIGVSGSLIAQGATDSPVVFTSFSDDEYGGDTDNMDAVAAGGVFSISIESNASIFNNVIVRYGGRIGYGVWGVSHEPAAALQIADGRGFVLEGSVFENNVHHLYWPNSEGLCEKLGTEGDSNVFDESADVTCTGNIPYP